MNHPERDEPIIQNPSSFNCFRVCARFVTAQSFTYSVAPAEVLTTVSLIGAELCFVKIIPSTPQHSAVLIIAPALCVSWIESNINKRG